MGKLLKAEMKDGTICQVDQKALVFLLEHNEVARFERSDGWAVVGLDPLRDINRESVFSIPERRH